MSIRSFARNIYVQAAAIYLAVRMLGVVVLAVMSAASDDDTTLIEWLTAWDGQWYLAIAEHGYNGMDRDVGLVDARGEFTQGYSAYAFFPLYPALVAAVARLPLLDTTFSALLVNVVAGVAIACGVVRLVRTLGYDSRTSLVLVALVAGAPMAISMSMAYTEAIFIALAVWALVFVLERSWILAGVGCAFAGLTRSTATVLVAVVVLAALVDMWRRGRSGHAIAGALIAPLGLLAYWGHVAAQTGSVSGWWDVQEGWITEVETAHRDDDRQRTGDRALGGLVQRVLTRRLDIVDVALRR